MSAEPMMSRRRFMARTSAAIDTLVRQLALESSERVDVRARMARYNRDCGCALGGAMMAAALLTVIAYIALTTTFSLGVVGTGIALIVVCSMLGKALGLVVASVRLEMLRRSLSRRARRLHEVNHVHLH
jgi:hypothetical protein